MLADGQEVVADVELYDLPTYRVLDGEDWDVIFSWTPQYTHDQPCESYPREVTITPVKPAEGPWEVHVEHEWEDEEAPGKTEIWTWDGKRYVLSGMEIDE